MVGKYIFDKATYIPPTTSQQVTKTSESNGYLSSSSQISKSQSSTEKAQAIVPVENTGVSDWLQVKSQGSGEKFTDLSTGNFKIYKVHSPQVLKTATSTDSPVLSIPRDRNGNFSPALLPAYGRRDDHLEEMVIKLYQTGVTTREISDIIERMYGHHYSPATISNISKATQENVATFHERSLEANYSVLFLDGTYLPLRRGTVSKECIHIALGITPEGQKAVLGYEIAPNENNASWSTLLDKLQNQGIQQVSLVVTDGFKGLEQIISQAYPLAKQQRCLIHISRNLASKVKRADRAVILEQFKTIYRAENLEMAVQALENFIAEWKPKYRKVMESLENTDNLLTFYQFTYQIWHSIYSTNLIESLNKEIKRQTKNVVTPKI
ncbi:IS256 family transposase [Lactococcus cremoris]|nr:IS256 family transposase [Lactococcus cremoris]QSD62649.2 IS256 family transposase [Lactococcus cremoris]